MNNNCSLMLLQESIARAGKLLVPSEQTSAYRQMKMLFFGQYSAKKKCIYRTPISFLALIRYPAYYCGDIPETIT